MVYLYRFRPRSSHGNFFLNRSGKPVAQVGKETDLLKKQFDLPYLCSSNARHVVETLKGSAGLDATASAGIINIAHNLHIVFMRCKANNTTKLCSPGSKQ